MSVSPLSLATKKSKLSAVIVDLDCHQDTILPCHPYRNLLVQDLLLLYNQSYLVVEKEEEEEEEEHVAAATNGHPIIPRRVLHKRSSVGLGMAAVERRLTEFHDVDYLRFLSRRESMTEPVLRLTKRPRVEDNHRNSSAWDAVRAAVSVPRELFPFVGSERNLPVSSFHHRDDDGNEDDPDDNRKSSSDNNEDDEAEGDVTYGLVSNCSPFEGMWRCAVTTVRGSLCAARSLLAVGVPSNSGGSSSSDGVETSLEGGDGGAAPWCAMHWWGGRHHAQRDQASGFCFLNDVVLAVQELKSNLPQPLTPSHPSQCQVMVLDVDAHHGDGTETAFFADPAVVTWSMHGYASGFFPGTGSTTLTGLFGRGHRYNVPLPLGAGGPVWTRIIDDHIQAVLSKHQPRAIVMVVGADALEGDPLGQLNFSIGEIQQWVRRVVQYCLLPLLSRSTTTAQQQQPVPLLLLGGGGYVEVSASRLWAAVTRDIAVATHQVNCAAATAVNETSAAESSDLGDLGDRGSLLFPSDEAPLLHRCSTGTVGVPVPEDTAYFEVYGPTFEMNGLPAKRVPMVTEPSDFEEEEEEAIDNEEDEGAEEEEEEEKEEEEEA